MTTNYFVMNFVGFKHLNCIELAAGSFCTKFYENMENSSDSFTADEGFHDGTLPKPYVREVVVWLCSLINFSVALKHTHTHIYIYIYIYIYMYIATTGYTATF
jgi:hypothetical protein